MGLAYYIYLYDPLILLYFINGNRSLVLIKHDMSELKYQKLWNATRECDLLLAHIEEVRARTLHVFRFWKDTISAIFKRH